MPDIQPDRTGRSGSVPNDWGNALARRWAPQLPRPLRTGFTKLMYALRALASASGELRYPDGKGIPLSQIATAACADLKDVRAWLAGGIAAGILAARQLAGRATVYCLVLHPAPNWAAAVAVIQQHADRRRQRRQKAGTPAPWTEPDQPREHPAPDASTPGDSPSTPAWGDSPSTPEPSTPGDSPHPHPGGQSPAHLGGPSPSQPCSDHVLHQEMAGVGPQPQDARGRARDEDDHRPAEEDAPGERPALRAVPELGGRGRRHGPDRYPGQAPLLLPVPGTHSDTMPGHLTDDDRERLRAAATPELVRQAVRELGHGSAVTLYGRHLVWTHAPDLLHIPTERTS